MRHQPSTKRILLTSFFVDCVDIVTNVIVAIFTGSAVMLAETLEGAADLAAVTLVLIGSRRSQHRPTSLHPFGYGKELYFWATLAAFIMLAITASLTFFFGYMHFTHPQPVQHLPLAYVVLAIAICTNGYSLFLSSRKLLAGRPWYRLPKAFIESWHIAPKITFVLDSIGATAACIGLGALLVYGITGDQRFDGLGAMVMGVVLGLFAVLLLFSVRSLIVGRSAPADVQRRVRRAIRRVPQVREVVQLRTMILSADSLLINVEVNLRNGLTTDEVEDVVSMIRREVKSVTTSDAQVYIEPVR